jgi:hypothetical protein
LADSSLFQGDRTLLAQHFASEIMDKKEKDTERSDVLLLLLRSAPNPRAADILRDSFARNCERPLKALLEGPRASERAAMILALAIGFQFFRKVIGSSALADASGAGLFDDLAAMFQSLIEGQPPDRRQSEEAASKVAIPNASTGPSIEAQWPPACA